MQTLLFYEPGHFHAALLLNSANPRVDRAVHVYATPGPELDRFVALIGDFNARSVQPTAWDLHLHTESDMGGHADRLGQLIAERRGELAVIAGRNEPKLAAIDRLHRAGIMALVDKPWLVDAAAVPHLDRVTTASPMVMDLMTGRHDVVNRLCRRVLTTSEVFGDVGSRSSGGSASGSGTGGAATSAPDLEFGSVHHLCKVVDGRALIRPSWYYDIGIQGDGMVDIHSHLVDQAQWLVDELRPSTADDGGWHSDDVRIEHAERWATPVPLADFAESTGLDSFPPSLLDRVSTSPSDPGGGPVLELACNGRISYRLRGVSVHQQTIWRVRSAVGGGDEHSFIARGSRCTVAVNQGPHTGDRPVVRLAMVDQGRHRRQELAASMASHLEDWQGEFPGLTMEADDGGYRLIIPESLATPHESVFAKVLDEFLDRAERADWSIPAASTIQVRYRLLAEAHQLAIGQR